VNPDGDNREASRRPVHLKAEIAGAGATVRGMVGDISLRGMLLRGSDFLPEKAECVVTIFPAEGYLPPFHAKGRVARVFGDGMGVEFTEMDTDSQDCLRFLIFNR